MDKLDGDSGYSDIITEALTDNAGGAGSGGGGIDDGGSNDMLFKDTSQPASTSPAKDDGGGDKGTTTKQADATPAPASTPAPSIDLGWLNQDKSGNLVDHQGNVVFKAGMARRVYESWKQNQSKMPAMEKELSELRQFRETARAVTDVVGDTGLDPDAIRAGLEVTAQFRKDPVGTIGQLIELAQSRGHDTSRLGTGPTATPDAIARIIEAKLQPFIQEREAVRQQQEAIDSGRQEAEEFLSDPNFPHARTHVELIAHIVRNEGIDPRAAYVKLLHAAAAKGLDFSRPLSGQIQQPPAAPTPTPRKAPVLQTATHVARGADDNQFDPSTKWLANLRSVYDTLK